MYHSTRILHVLYTLAPLHLISNIKFEKTIFKVLLIDLLFCLLSILGARTFVPHPVSLTIDNVGGTATLLGLVAMAKDVEGLYAAVKALVCVVKSNRAAQQEMDRMKRYQVIFFNSSV